MSGTPRISVVIPSYNCGKYVAEAVESALAQTCPPGEVIVVDDGSADDTPQRMEPFTRRGVIYIRQANAGVSAARNAGIARSTGELIAFLDADDAWLAEKLKLQVDVLARRPDLGLVGTRLFDWPATSLPVAPDAGSVAVTEVPLSSLVVRNHLATSSILVRRAAVEAAGAGPFDTALHGPEDYDLWLRIARVWKVALLDAPLTGYRCTQGSLGKQAVTMEAGMRRILAKLDGQRVWSTLPGARLLRRRAYAYVDYSCAYMYGAADQFGIALARLFRSLVVHPQPLDRADTSIPFARLRLLRSLGVNAFQHRVRGGAGRGAAQRVDGAKSSLAG